MVPLNIVKFILKLFLQILYTEVMYALPPCFKASLGLWMEKVSMIWLYTIEKHTPNYACDSSYICNIYLHELGIELVKQDD